MNIVDKRDAEDMWTYSDDGDTTPQNGEDEKDDFCAIRGKKDEEMVIGDFWTTKSFSVYCKYCNY